MRIWKKQIRKNTQRSFFAHLKKVHVPFAPHKAALKDRSGKVIHDQESIKQRWREYMENLYADENQRHRGNEDPEQSELEPNILEVEVEQSLKQLPSRKAPDIDGLPV